MKLDLHGIRHIEVSNKVDSFLWEAIQRNAPSVEIVTGNSKRMKMSDTIHSTTIRKTRFLSGLE